MDERKKRILERLEKIRTIVVDNVTYELSAKDKKAIREFVLNNGSLGATIELQAHPNSVVRPKDGKKQVYLDQIVSRLDLDLQWSIQELSDLMK